MHNNTFFGSNLMVIVVFKKAQQITIRNAMFSQCDLRERSTTRDD